MTLDSLVSLLSFIIGSQAIHRAVKGRLFDSASIHKRNSESSTKQSIFIIRHGDRYDYKIGTERWEETVNNICPFHHIREHDRVMNDPPLSDLGLQQTIDLGAYFEKVKDSVNIHRVVSSPFLRCIQTINPIAAALDLPICLDDAFFEAKHTQIIDDMPTLKERATYFPRVNMHYKSSLRPQKDEEYPAATIERFGEAIQVLIERFPDENIVVVTHAAAAVAIVARILGCKISDVNPASAASIYRLDRDGIGSPWLLDNELNGSVAHLTELGLTEAWPDKHKPTNLPYIVAGDAASWVCGVKPSC